MNHIESEDCVTTVPCPEGPDQERVLSLPDGVVFYRPRDRP